MQYLCYSNRSNKTANRRNYNNNNNSQQTGGRNNKYNSNVFDVMDFCYFANGLIFFQLFFFFFSQQTNLPPPHSSAEWAFAFGRAAVCFAIYCTANVPQCSCPSKLSLTLSLALPLSLNCLQCKACVVYTLYSPLSARRV